jgi:hypothetical protein
MSATDLSVFVEAQFAYGGTSNPFGVVGEQIPRLSSEAD